MSTANKALDLDQFDDDLPEDASCYFRASEIKDLDLDKIKAINSYRTRKALLTNIRKIVLGLAATAIVLVLALT